MKTYQITLNEAQMRLIADCLEDVSRFASGQWSLQNTIEEMVKVAAPKDYKRQIEMRDEAEEHLRRAKNCILDFSDNASYSYNGTDFIGNTYQIYRTILHELNKDAEDWNVYKSPALPSGNLGTIKIEEI